MKVNRYILGQWKLGIHLCLRTQRFGVNNQWWSSFSSMFGTPWWIQLWAIFTVFPLVRNYRTMKWRAGGGIHMMTDERYERMFGHDKPCAH